MSATERAANLEAESLFSASLAQTDPEIADAIRGELGRQRDEIELIASENIVSRAVLEAQGSVLTNKYAEGYPGKRYYGGCQFVDIAEQLAIDRVTKLFGCKFRECAAAFRRVGECRGLLRADESRRHVSGPQSRRRRASHARHEDQHVGQMVQRRALQCAAATITASTSMKCASLRTSTSRRSSSRAARPIRASSISGHSARSPMKSARSCSSTWRISQASSRAARIRRHSRMRMSSRPRRTRLCAVRAAA